MPLPYAKINVHKQVKVKNVGINIYLNKSTKPEENKQMKLQGKNKNWKNERTNNREQNVTLAQKHYLSEHFLRSFHLSHLPITILIISI